jgi:RNA recognition motif-containing protein
LGDSPKQGSPAVVFHTCLGLGPAPPPNSCCTYASIYRLRFQSALPPVGSMNAVVVIPLQSLNLCEHFSGPRIFPPHCNLLCLQTTDQRLRTYFENYGAVSEAFVSFDRTTGRPRGFGFVVFEDSTVADKVVSAQHTIDRREVTTPWQHSPLNPPGSLLYQGMFG